MYDNYITVILGFALLNLAIIYHSITSTHYCYHCAITVHSTFVIAAGSSGIDVLICVVPFPRLVNKTFPHLITQLIDQASEISAFLLEQLVWHSKLRNFASIHNHDHVVISDSFQTMRNSKNGAISKSGANGFLNFMICKAIN